MIDKKAYINAKGLTCLFCGAESVQGGFVQIEAGKAFQEMSCTECEGAWLDVYKLVEVIPNQEGGIINERKNEAEMHQTRGSHEQ